MCIGKDGCEDLGCRVFLGDAREYKLRIEGAPAMHKDVHGHVESAAFEFDRASMTGDARRFYAIDDKTRSTEAMRRRDMFRGMDMITANLGRDIGVFEVEAGTERQSHYVFYGDL